MTSRSINFSHPLVQGEKRSYFSNNHLHLSPTKLLLSRTPRTCFVNNHRHPLKLLFSNVFRHSEKSGEFSCFAKQFSDKFLREKQADELLGEGIIEDLPGQILATVANVKPGLATATLSVFSKGTYGTKDIIVKTSSSSSSPPEPLYIVTPVEKGTYKVILFFPGTCLSNKSYSKLFEHMASHGFIVVAPQLYTFLPPSGNKEVDSAAEVINWLLSTGLQSNLPENVAANLNLVALMGHSRGGQTAFAVALGYAKIGLQFSAIVGIDPVAGTSKDTELDPPILSVDSFNFTMPVTVIGTGLGGVSRWFMSCAPEGANYEEFFNRSSKSSRARFVATDYGHMDMLDDNPSDLKSRIVYWILSKFFCKNGNESRDLMRRCLGGVAVAFLKDYFEGEIGNFKKIVNEPSVAPIKLESLQFVEA